MTATTTPGMVRSWAWITGAVVFTVLLLATLEIAPRIWYKILPTIEPYLGLIVIIGGSLLWLSLIVKAWTAGPRRRATGVVLVCLSVFLAAVLLLTFFASATPGGKLHVIEYAILAYIVFNGLQIESTNSRAILVGTAALLLLGIVDEGIQYLLPSRFFDLVDIAGNWMASSLGFIVWVAASRHSPWRATSPQ